MLLTEWQTLATAGATVDGREISEQWLADIAETYDREKYTAVINADHERWYGNFGHVHEVRLGQSSDGKTTLEGRLAPNFRLVEMNRNGQRLFMSIEVNPSFADSGRAYLGGLAVTDSPASLGTSMLKFNAKNAVYSEPSSFALSLPTDNDESERGLLKKLMRLLSGNHEFMQTPESPATDQQDTDMTPEQFQKLTEQNEAIINGLSALTETASSAFARAEALEALTADDQHDDAETVTAEQFNALQKKMTELVEQFETLKTTPVGGTGIPPNGGDANEIEFI